MSYPAKTYVIGNKKYILNNIQYELGNYFNSQTGVKILDMLTEEYFKMESDTEYEMCRYEGVRRFIQSIKDVVNIITHSKLENIKEK